MYKRQVFLIGVGAVAWMIVPCPEGWMPEGWKPSAEQAKVLKTRDYSLGQMCRTPVFWVCLLYTSTPPFLPRSSGNDHLSGIVNQDVYKRQVQYHVCDLGCL